jgi:transcriptional/translational regulatory protein YebC/TACO1
MGKLKGFIIQALDNGEDPFYNYSKLKQRIQDEKVKNIPKKEITNEFTNAVRKGSYSNDLSICAASD